MPRILAHHEELLDAAEAKFRAVLFKDHFYAGMPHAILLEKLFPETGVKLYSGIELNNASGGINPHAVDDTIKLGGKIVWMSTLSAANHIEAMAKGKSTFHKTAKKMLDPVPLSAPTAGSPTIQRRSSTSSRKPTSSWPADICLRASCTSCSTRRRGAASRR